MLKITGILLVIAGGYGIIVVVPEVPMILAALKTGAAAGQTNIILLALIVSLVGSVIYIITGFFGFLFSKIPDKMNICVVMGVLSMLVTLAGLAIHFTIQPKINKFEIFIELAVPVLYLYAAIGGKERIKEMLW